MIPVRPAAAARRARHRPIHALGEPLRPVLPFIAPAPPARLAARERIARPRPTYTAQYPRPSHVSHRYAARSVRLSQYRTSGLYSVARARNSHRAADGSPATIAASSAPAFARSA